MNRYKHTRDALAWAGQFRRNIKEMGRRGENFSIKLSGSVVVANLELASSGQGNNKTSLKKEKTLDEG